MTVTVVFEYAAAVGLDGETLSQLSPLVVAENAADCEVALVRVSDCELAVDP